MTLINTKFNKFTYLYSFVEKRMRYGLVALKGRTFMGRISMHHRGGGLKRRHFRIDRFRRIDCFGNLVKVIRTVYYTSLIGILLYDNGLSTYITLSKENVLGTVLYSGTIIHEDLEVNVPGTALPLQYAGLFSIVHDIEIKPYAGSVLVRAAGTGAMVSTKQDTNVFLKLRSG
jgi:large subunit ribosomal protein L2